MKDKVKNINIHIDNKTSVNSLINGEFYNLLKQGFNIIDINNDDLALLLKINKKLNGKCTIFSFASNTESSLRLKKGLKGTDNITVFNTQFENNYLKNDIADVIIGNDILSCRNRNYADEINRTLNKNGKIFFIENISIDKLPRHCLVKRKDNLLNIITNKIENNLKYIKDCDYRIKIIGNSNFSYNSDDYTGYLEFCDIFRSNLFSSNNAFNNLLTFVIEGSLNYPGRSA